MFSMIEIKGRTLLARAEIARYWHPIGRKKDEAILLVESDVIVEKKLKVLLLFSKRAHYVIFYPWKKIDAITARAYGVRPQNVILI